MIDYATESYILEELARRVCPVCGQPVEEIDPPKDDTSSYVLFFKCPGDHVFGVGLVSEV